MFAPYNGILSDVTGRCDVGIALFRTVNTGTPYYIRQEHSTSSVDTYWPRKAPELKSRCASAPSFHLLLDLPFRRLRTCVRDVTHVRVAEVYLILVRFGKKGDEKLLEILATRSLYPFVVQTTLNKGGLILEWPPKKFSTPTRIHIRRHVRVSTWVHVLSRRSLVIRYADKLHYAAQGYRPVSVSPAGARTRVKHWITRRWRPSYFIRYRFRRVLISTSQNLSTILSYSLHFDSSIC